MAEKSGLPVSTIKHFENAGAILLKQLLMLASAYNLTRSTGPGGEHTTDVAGKGKDITSSDMLKVADAAGIDTATADAIMQQVQEAVSGST